jgi:hypothetical protein
MTDEIQYHFFASSQLTWHTGTDLLKLINTQKKADQPKAGLRATGFNVYVVPLPESAHYSIDEYKPEVTGSYWLWGYNYETKQARVRSLLGADAIKIGGEK